MNIRKIKAFITSKISNEISDKIYYHGVHHTLEVLHVCNEYIKRLKINKKDAYLLRTAALLHDIGFIWTNINHEERGVQYAKQILPEWGYKDTEIDIICNLIMATKIPQKPQNLLEMIICDADLDYLGTERFYDTGRTLYQELLNFGMIENEKSWDKIQINFMSSHEYQTEFAKKHRQPLKRKHLKEIMEK